MASFSCTCSSHVVAVDVITCAITHIRRTRGIAGIGNGYLCHAVFIDSGRSSFVVNVHNVDIAATYASVAAVSVAPVVHDLVAEINDFGLQGVGILYGMVVFDIVFAIARPAKTWHTVLHVTEEIMMERGFLTAPNATIAMLTLGVTRVGQCLA